MNIIYRQKQFIFVVLIGLVAVSLRGTSFEIVNETGQEAFVEVSIQYRKTTRPKYPPKFPYMKQLLIQKQPIGVQAILNVSAMIFKNSDVKHFSDIVALLRKGSRLDVSFWTKNDPVQRRFSTFSIHDDELTEWYHCFFFDEEHSGHQQQMCSIVQDTNRLKIIYFLEANDQNKENSPFDKQQGSEIRTRAETD